MLCFIFFAFKALYAVFQISHYSVRLYVTCDGNVFNLSSIFVFHIAKGEFIPIILPDSACGPVHMVVVPMLVDDKCLLLALPSTVVMLDVHRAWTPRTHCYVVDQVWKVDSCLCIQIQCQ